MPSTQDIITLGPGARYRLERPIGASSHGEIWSATWLENDHPVAIKFLRQDQLDSLSEASRAWMIDSLNREIAFLRRHRAGHLLRLLRHGEVDGLPVMVMEHLAGTLHEHIQSAGPLPLAHALEWLRQIAEGLKALHAAGLRHLDLKPQNLLLGTAHAGLPRLRIADFGASLPLTQAEHPLLGTPGWQAPEQFIPFERGPQGYRYRTDQATDWYALGLLFHYMVTGESTEFAKQCRELHRLNPQHAAWAERERLAVGLQDIDRARFLQVLSGGGYRAQAMQFSAANRDSMEDETWPPGKSLAGAPPETSRKGGGQVPASVPSPFPALRPDLLRMALGRLEGLLHPDVSERRLRKGGFT